MILYTKRILLLKQQFLSGGFKQPPFLSADILQYKLRDILIAINKGIDHVIKIADFFDNSTVIGGSLYYEASFQQAPEL